ncbi:putative target of rapamycin (TOR) kinase 1 [Leptomonas pyrrhocoris]|uniref:Putative target of rapamycin (TOR) kinase 1 n=1 Tax=Leptomonas pyrrhocoris TaxID=157538 RepID=A0A0M9G7Q2_LEPPY|nr:putative target of rapamycin (TOR) kinase 1 [Leptomonas pyrrhocoris]KPA84400.1 putative target of rapamycin (TOR) kinase 1 [Leptomonas pyrrhocoris]|eukprot:XP_015662839.1 putative target of rapamycin (TOR) kinase 1 [Leptomonas pyrrhocoris]
MLPHVLERFDHIWELLGQPPPIEDDKRRHSRRLSAKDADLLRATGVVSLATPSKTRGWVIPFTVVEERESGWRRRMIAWPRAKNAHDVYEARLPLQHVAYYLDAVGDDIATTVDLKASFFQVELPPAWRSLYRFRDTRGTLLELTRLPMGYVASPEVMQLLVMAVAGHPDVVRKEFANPQTVRTDVWTDNIRLSGNATVIQAAQAALTITAQQANVTIGDQQWLARRYTFLGVVYNHTTKTVALASKFTRKCAEAPPHAHMTVADLEVFISRAFFASAVLDIPMINYYFLLKLTRRHLSALNRGLCKLGDGSALSPSVTKLAESLHARIIQNLPRCIRPVESTPISILATDASEHGWGAVFLPPCGPQLVVGGRWTSPPPPPSSSCKPRHAPCTSLTGRWRHTFVAPASTCMLIIPR